MASKQLAVGDKDLTLNDMHAVLFSGQEVTLSAKAMARVNKSYAFLNEFSKGKLIYGINTGFGPMAQYVIPDKDLRKLQYNLIHSHCSGTGRLIPERDIKALMLA